MKTATESIPVVGAMHRGIVTCDVETPLSKVAQMMVGHRIHCVVVNSRGTQGSRPWGVISDLDLTAAFANEQVGDTSAGEIAATPAGEPRL